MSQEDIEVLREVHRGWSQRDFSVRTSPQLACPLLRMRREQARPWSRHE